MPPVVTVLPHSVSLIIQRQVMRVLTPPSSLLLTQKLMSGAHASSELIDARVDTVFWNSITVG